MKKLVRAAVTAAVVVATALPASAASGDPDPTFGTGGHVRTDFAGSFDIAEGAAIQPNGRIVAVGQADASPSSFDSASFGIARYLTNGDPDPSFSGDGKVQVDVGPLGDSASAIALQSDGRIVVAGLSSTPGPASDIAVVRLTKGGAPDTTFSGDGKVRTAFPGTSSVSAAALAVQDDGKIVVVGTAQVGAPHLSGRGGGGAQSDIAVARYKPNGALDPTFGGGDGRVTTDFAGASDVGSAVALLDSGDILVAGLSQTAGFEQRVVVVEYRTNGTRDPAFSGDGKVVVNMSPGNSESACGIAVRGDGKIVVGASVEDGVSASSGADVGVLLLRADGSVATAFGGGDGKVFQDFGGVEDPDEMARDTDGTLVFVGTRPFASAASPQAIWVFRLKASGAKDTGFGTGGRAELDDAEGVGGFGLAVDGSHRPVAVGRVGIGDGADFAVARFQA